jgi:hypothetical protein
MNGGKLLTVHMNWINTTVDLSTDPGLNRICLFVHVQNKLLHQLELLLFH